MVATFNNAFTPTTPKIKRIGNCKRVKEQLLTESSHKRDVFKSLLLNALYVIFYLAKSANKRSSIPNFTSKSFSMVG